MLKLMFLSLFILSFTNATYSQFYKPWYETYCDVTDINNITSEEFECLWNKSTTRLEIGAITTMIGTTIMVGTVIWLSNFDTGPESELLVPAIAFGSFGLGTGLVLNMVGIPTMIIGASRRSYLKKSVHYETYKLGYIQVSPSIGKNIIDNTYNYGVTLSITF